MSRYYEKGEYYVRESTTRNGQVKEHENRELWTKGAPLGPAPLALDDRPFGTGSRLSSRFPSASAPLRSPLRSSFSSHELGFPPTSSEFRRKADEYDRKVSEYERRSPGAHLFDRPFGSRLSDFSTRDPWFDRPRLDFDRDRDRLHRPKDVDIGRDFDRKPSNLDFDRDRDRLRRPIDADIGRDFDHKTSNLDFERERERDLRRPIDIDVGRDFDRKTSNFEYADQNGGNGFHSRPVTTSYAPPPTSPPTSELPRGRSSSQQPSPAYYQTTTTNHSRPGSPKPVAGAGEIVNTEHGFTIQLDVHHFQPEDIKVHLAGDTLTVSGDRIDDADPSGQTLRRSFSRKYAIPRDVKASSISSHLRDDGFLIIEGSRRGWKETNISYHPDPSPRPKTPNSIISNV